MHVDFDGRHWHYALAEIWTLKLKFAPRCIWLLMAIGCTLCHNNDHWNDAFSVSIFATNWVDIFVPIRVNLLQRTICSLGTLRKAESRAPHTLHLSNSVDSNAYLSHAPLIYKCITEMILWCWRATTDLSINLEFIETIQSSPLLFRCR